MITLEEAKERFTEIRDTPHYPGRVWRPLQETELDRITTLAELRATLNELLDELPMGGHWYTELLVLKADIEKSVG